MHTFVTWFAAFIVAIVLINFESLASANTLEYRYVSTDGKTIEFKDGSNRQKGLIKYFNDGGDGFFGLTACAQAVPFYCLLDFARPKNIEKLPSSWQYDGLAYKVTETIKNFKWLSHAIELKIIEARNINGVIESRFMFSESFGVLAFDIQPYVSDNHATLKTYILNGVCGYGAIVGFCAANDPFSKNTSVTGQSK